MAAELFKNKEFSEVYHKYMIPMSSKVVDLILTYVEDKKMGKPFKLAVDVGCGTGNSSRKLAAHFQEVIGADTSESQLNVARSCTSENITCILSPSESLPLEDNSVDLLNASLAVHWFDVERFMQEAARVLKPGGCLALSSWLLKTEIYYKDHSETLTNIFNEAVRHISKYSVKILEHMKSEYETIFEAVPFSDKERINDILEIYPVTVTNLLGLIQALYLYQEFLEEDRKEALMFLQNVEKRFLDALGENDFHATMEVHLKHVCVLACKPILHA
ncbi:methyltransferase DDB_G0268948 isoform X2 [Pelobates cultripes]|uniref:Methyltransferase DDB_G0268948 isoform X2 n=1 Tax=Pelobates cultripes TaxID=61616 RepID=A0AAD1SQ49_PELCU|nr:methyltransferase DDB_G0268948 isoform X2 [Pelobates cultripes]